jgi:carbon-monoxide dehydrogenase large subunit
VARARPDLKIGTYYPLAKDVVRYVGDPVAVVVAETIYQAHDAVAPHRARTYDPASVLDSDRGAPPPGAADPPEIAGNQAFH